MASFIICLAYRRTHKQTLWGRSCCDNCLAILPFYSLIPILGYFLCKGSCKSCNKKISILYPCLELVGGFLQLLTVRFYGYDYHILILWLLFYLAVYDYLSFEIADDALSLLLLWGFINNCFSLSKLLGALLLLFLLLVLSLIMELLYKEAMIGGGDFKLLFVSGMYLGFYGNLCCLFVASILGLLMIVSKRERMIAFGPAITTAFYFMLRLFC